MSTPEQPIVILGGGPAGMATALSLKTAGHAVVIYERYPEARPAGNILNLWPPPIKALAAMGVDTRDLGAPCHSTFRSAAGHVRADIRIPDEVVDSTAAGSSGCCDPTSTAACSPPSPKACCTCTPRSPASPITATTSS